MKKYADYNEAIKTLDDYRIGDDPKPIIEQMHKFILAEKLKNRAIPVKVQYTNNYWHYNCGRCNQGIYPWQIYCPNCGCRLKHPSDKESKREEK